MQTEIGDIVNMGTLKELIDYIESKSGVQEIIVIYNNERFFEGFTNSRLLQAFYETRVTQFNWIFKLSKIICVVADELP